MYSKYTLIVKKDPSLKIKTSSRHPFIALLRFVFLLVVSLSEASSGGGLDLSEWVRSSRQLSAEDSSGGVALGLVSALQKWANSLETKMVGLKDSNVQLIQVGYCSQMTIMIDKVGLKDIASRTSILSF